MTATQGTGLAVARRLVPVLAASAGAGRSSTTALLAQAFGERHVLVLDTAARVSSPWMGWTDRHGTSTTALPQTAEAASSEALSRLPGARGHVDVLTELSDRTDEPAPAHDAMAWIQLAGDTPYPIVLADTRDELLPLLVSWAHGGGDPMPSLWLSAAWSRPLLCVPASARGIDEAVLAVTLMEQLGLHPERVTIAVVGLHSSDVPRWVQAGLTLLEPRVSSIVRLPHNRQLVAGAHPLLAKADSRTRRAYAHLARHLDSPATATAAVPTKEDAHALVPTR